MANVRLSEATRCAMLNALRDQIDGAEDRLGEVRIFDGVQPATSNDPVTDQKLLVVLRFGSYPCAPPAPRC